MVVHIGTNIPATWETEGEGLQIQGHCLKKLVGGRNIAQG